MLGVQDGVCHSCFGPLGQRFYLALPVVIILALFTESEPCWMEENTIYTVLKLGRYALISALLELNM